MQSDRPTTLERAFALARTGEFRSKGEIAKALSREGFSVDELRQLHGISLSRQLKEICRASRAEQPEAEAA
jgi:hypothetical protein